MELHGCTNECCKRFDGCSSGSKMEYPPCAKNAMESGTNSIQKLKAEIAAHLSKVDGFPKYNIPGPAQEFIDAMRRLSAV